MHPCPQRLNYAKVKQMEEINHNRISFLVETKGSSFGWGSKCNPCATSSAALICHQARGCGT